VFLEEALRDTVNAFNRRTRLFEPIVDNFLDKVSNEVFSDSGVHLLVPVKDSLQSFEMQVRQSLDILTDLLNNRDKMMSMLLTDQAHSQLIGIDMPDDRLEDVELLLDEYARQLNNTLLEISSLLQRVQSKQEFVTLALSSYRNRMIRMNVMIGIAGISMGMGTFVSGYFGMNVFNGLEQSHTAFYNIIMGTSVAGMIVAGSSLNYLSGRTMQRRAAFRLGELETLSSALSDMCALDYTLKAALEEYGAKPMNKQEFGLELRKARSSRIVTEREVDLLFDIFDIVKDGHIGSDDFASPDQFHLPSKPKQPPELPSIMDG
jgi:magnesium transporter